MPRFHAPDLQPADLSIALPHDEAQHLVRVLRLGPGQEVEVFNGRGYQCRATIELADKRGVVLRVVGPRPAADELPFVLTLAQALLKPDRMDDLVRDAVMLGVTGVQPVVTRHVDAPLRGVVRGHRVSRWQRIAVSSTKQCGRAVVPWVAEPEPFADVLAGGHGELRVMLVEPRASAGVGSLRELSARVRPQAVTVLAGPEGGWAADEIAAAASAGVQLVTLGARTLRADAIALVALPVLLYTFGALE